MTIRKQQHSRQPLATRVAGVLLVMAAAFVAPLATPSRVVAQTPVITTWAGGGPPAGAVAAAVSVGAPNSVAKDALDNYYIASSETDLVYRVDAAGLLSVFGGGGTRPGSAADGHPALEAALNRPSHVVWFADGLYVVDGQRIRRIDTLTGLVSTVTGGGTLPFTDRMPAGDLGTACPSGLAISPAGDIYYTDLCDNTIKRIDGAGLVTRVAGMPAARGGFSGDGGPAALAQFRRPEELALEPDTGDLALIDQAYRAETGVVRRILAGADGVVTGAADETIVSLTAGGCCEIGPVNDGMAALQADMRGLTAIGYAEGSIIVAQTYEGPGFLWRINRNGTLRLLGGVDSMTRPRAPGLGDGGLAVDARFGVIAGLVQVPNLDILIADRGLHAVRRINDIEVVERIAGNAAASLSGDSGPATGAQLYRPGAIQFDGAGNAVFIDQDRGRLRLVNATTGAITSATPGMPDGSPFRPLTVALHPLTGHIHFAGGDERIHAFDPVTNTVTTVAGTGQRTCSLDCEGGDPGDDLGDFGPAMRATFNSPVSLAFDAIGNLYVADLGNHRVRRIDAATGVVRTVAGIDIAGSGGYLGDGAAPVYAQLRNPWAVAIGPDGTLFIADTGNNRIRAVTPQANGLPSIGGGIISTVVSGYSPRALAVDGTGRLFFGGSGYADVNVWDGANVSVFVNSQGIPGFSGDGGPAIDARISTARGLTVAGGALFIADDTNHRIRVVRAGGGTPDLSVVKSTTSTFQQGGTATYDLAVSNIGTAPTTGTYTLTDLMPAGLAATAASGTGWDCGGSTTTTVACTNTTVLAPGQAAPIITIAVDIAATAPASITNTATVAGGGQSDTTNDTSSVTTTVTQIVPDLAIAKSTASTFQQGGTATYDLVVSNGGNGPTTQAYTLTDVLPTGLTLAGTMPGAGWDCTASTTAVVSCVRSTALPAGQAAHAVTITVDIAADAPASVTNSASVAGGGETNTANNTASVTAVVTAASVPDLVVTMTSHSPTVSPGGWNRYYFTVQNVGSGPSTAAYTFTSNLPAAFVEAMPPFGAGWDCSASRVPYLSISCTRATSIPDGGSAPPIQVTAFVSTSWAGPVTTTATVSGGGETNTTNNAASITSSLVRPDLAVSINTTSPLQQLGTAVYSVSVANVGSGEAAAVSGVSASFGPFLTVTSVSPAAGWSCSRLTFNVRCELTAPIAPAATAAPIVITVAVAGNAPSTVTATAGVFPRVIGDLDSANDVASVTSAVRRAAPDLSLTKTSSGNFLAGGTATYTLTVSNVGTVATPGGTQGTYFIEDVLPAGVVVTAGTGAGWVCVPARAFTCRSSAPIAPGASAPPVTLTLRIEANPPRSITNTARVIWSLDTNLANNSSSVTDVVSMLPADMTIRMLAAGSFRRGGLGQYRLIASNLSTGDTTGPVTVRDVLPAGLTLAWIPSGTGWTCTVASTSEFSCLSAGPVPGRRTMSPIRFLVQVAQDAPAVVTNTATVSGGGDVTPANNSSSATTNVR